MTVGTSFTEIAGEISNSIRSVFVITNTSTLNQTVSISIGSEAVIGQGITLAPGASYYENIDARFTPTQKRITAVASAAGATLSVHERLVVV